MNKVWFITGASRGLGRAYAEEALSRGDKVVAAARNAKRTAEAFGENPNLLVLALDVARKEQIEPAVRKALAAFGRIDILVNNAGYGIFCALEEISDEETRELFETCVFGLINVSKAVIPVMRSQGGGRIINVSSKSGLVGDPGGSVYNAAKFAVDGFSEGLNLELSDWGVQVMSLCPGTFRTDFRDSSSRREPALIMKEYEGKLGHKALDASRAGNRKQAGDPKKAARLLYEVAVSKRMPVRLPMGADVYEAWENKLSFAAREMKDYKERSQATRLEGAD